MASIFHGSKLAVAAAVIGAASSSSLGHEAGAGAAGIPRRPAASAAADSLVSRFHGAHLAAEVKPVKSQNVKRTAGKTSATAAVKTGVEQYTLPTWADFEMGRPSVYWETMNGRPPTAGKLLAIYFNPAASELTPYFEHGIGFNCTSYGGFNQSIMCGGEPRVMTKKERGSLCELIHATKINEPVHDGTNWDGPCKLAIEMPLKLEGMPQSYFDKGLAKELAHEGACESAIYQDAVFFQDWCAFPAGIVQQGGDRCELNIVPGCTYPESPFFNPLANVEMGPAHTCFDSVAPPLSPNYLVTKSVDASKGRNSEQVITPLCKELAPMSSSLQ